MIKIEILFRISMPLYLKIIYKKELLHKKMKFFSPNLTSKFI